MSLTTHESYLLNRLMEVESDNIEVEADKARLKGQLEEANSALQWAIRFIETVPIETVKDLAYDDENDPDGVAFGIVHSQHIEAASAYIHRWSPSISLSPTVTLGSVFDDLETAQAEYDKGVGILREAEELMEDAEAYLGILSELILFDAAEEDDDPAAIAFHTAMAQHDDARQTFLTHWGSSAATDAASMDLNDLGEHKAACSRLTWQIAEAWAVVQWAERVHDIAPKEINFRLGHNALMESAFQSYRQDFIEALESFKGRYSEEQEAAE